MKSCGAFPNFPLFIALVIGFLSGCATKPFTDPKITSTVAAYPVRATTASKIQNGQTLNYHDIQHLVRVKMPASIVISYLESTEKTYHFSPGQLDSLKNLGASSQLVNYLNESKGFYRDNNPAHSSSSFRWPRLKNNSSKFKTRPPGDVMDPAYEESLYSPFFL